MSRLVTQQFNVGVAFRCTLVDGKTGVDLTNAELVEFAFSAPGGRRFLRTGVKVDPPTNGTVEYLTGPGDLAEHGKWCYQLHARGPGFDLWGEVVEFTVEANLTAPAQFARPDPVELRLYLPMVATSSP